jgi:DNA invertase Pin-like site-specific DNA recombinase
MKTYVAYYRVSTTKQGESGLGLEAQRNTVHRYCHDGKLAGEFTEVESGKNDERPQLEGAIQAAKKHKATLVIAKLDRLSRNLTFISQLMDQGVKFVCCDMPEANEFTIHIFAALAQQERKLISKRTKDALAVLKAQGVKLGSPQNLPTDAWVKAVAVRQQKAASNPGRKQAKELVIRYRKEGYTLQMIADKLNSLGMQTIRGCQYTPMQVKRLIGSGPKAVPDPCPPTVNRNLLS